DRNYITPNQMTRGKFYLIKDYQYVDGTKGKFTESNAPIIYTLFVSASKDMVHCVKVSNVNPTIIKRFFGKFVNEETEMLEMKGGSMKFYENVVSKVPVVSNNSYRTYKLSGLTKIIELSMDVNELTPKRMNVIGISKKSQLKNR
ncbi:MAG: hypothetical protein EBS55_07535, partial [Flavobacteriaceae bacterium]|nr:hypothetical protein [Flavobacteriaceae bacterium]